MVVSKPALARKIEPAPTWSTKTRGKVAKLDLTEKKLSAPVHGEIDLINRNPTGTNDHIKVLFEDVLAEPASHVHSVVCLWTNSWKCYNCWKNCCYRIPSLVCGAPLAACYGCQFAAVVFSYVWICRPFTLVLRCVLSKCIGECFRKVLSCCAAPFFAACGDIFWAFSPSGRNNHVLPHTQSNGNTGGISSKVKFNDKIKTKMIPRIDKTNGIVVGPRRLSTLPQKTVNAAVPIAVKPAGKQLNPPGKSSTLKVGIGNKSK